MNLTFLIFVLISIVTTTQAFQFPFFRQMDGSGNQSPSDETMAGNAAAKRGLNVFKQPLAHLSSSPITGFTRTGYCEVPAGDFGNHAVAAELTDEFLTYTEQQGNPLRSMAGLQPGCKWCLCASRWLEAFKARKSDDDKIVPRVFMESTHEKALSKVEMGDLQKFAHEKSKGAFQDMPGRAAGRSDL